MTKNISMNENVVQIYIVNTKNLNLNIQYFTKLNDFVFLDKSKIQIKLSNA